MSLEHDNNVLLASAETMHDSSTTDSTNARVPSAPDPVQLSDQQGSSVTKADGDGAGAAGAEHAASPETALPKETTGAVSAEPKPDDSLPQADGATSAVDAEPVNHAPSTSAHTQVPAQSSSADGQPREGAAKTQKAQRAKDNRGRREPRSKNIPKAPSRPVASDDQLVDESMEHMDELMAQYASPARPSGEGEAVEGRVVAITEAGVVVDIGGKLEGLIPAQEMMEIGAPLPFDPGQTHRS